MGLHVRVQTIRLGWEIDWHVLQLHMNMMVHFWACTVHMQTHMQTHMHTRPMALDMRDACCVHAHIAHKLQTNCGLRSST